MATKRKNDKTFEELSTELANLASSLGINRNDNLRLKKVVEALALEDQRKDSWKRVGWDKIYQNYGAMAYTKLFNEARKNWPVEYKAPEPEEKKEEVKKEINKKGFLLWVSVERDPHLVAQKVGRYLFGTLNDKTGRVLSVKDVGGGVVEVLIESSLSVNLLFNGLSKLDNVLNISTRNYEDFGKDYITLRTLEDWDKNGKI